MKCRITTAATAGFVAIAAAGAAGQEYDLNWHSIDGGSGVMAAGDVSLAGTVGQPDAGAMSGDDLTVAGGFWPGIGSGGSDGCTHQESIDKLACKVKRGSVKKAIVRVRGATPGKSYIAILDTGEHLEKPVKPNGRVKFVFKRSNVPPCGSNAVTVCDVRRVFDCGC